MENAGKKAVGRPARYVTVFVPAKSAMRSPECAAMAPAENAAMRRPVVVPAVKREMRNAR